MTRAALGKGLAALLGVLIGAISIYVLPSSWLFVSATSTESSTGEGDPVQYACPMFCVVMEELPTDGKCAVCGMDMTVVSSDSTLNDYEQMMIGLEADAVRRLPLVRSLRVVGEADYDETRLARITTRVAGWLETVWVDATWTEVTQGEPLAAIYSPELYSAQKEYLVAWNANVRGDSGSSNLLRAARRRLELFGIDAREIEELQTTEVVRDSVVLRAPMSGVVVERRALEGASVTRGSVLYTVADLSKVWIQALVFENDLSWVRIGQSARLRVDGQSDDIAGQVAFVDPAIDRNSRTARVRIEVDNPKGAQGKRLFRIGQRVDAWLQSRLASDGTLLEPGASPDELTPLAVPRSALLRTGERNLIYLLFAEVETANGRERDYHLDPRALPNKLWYEPMEVQIGPLARLEGVDEVHEYYPILRVVKKDTAAGDDIEVLSLERLTEGVTVVTKGNLLLDSQAQLAGKPSLLFPHGNRGTPDDPHAGH